MLIIVIGTIIFVYYLAASLKNEFIFSGTFTKIIRLVQLVLLLVIILLLILSRSDIYLRGYWAFKIIFWCWFVLVMLLYAFGSKNHINKIEYFSYKILFFLPLGFIPLLIIPFIGAAIALRFHETFIGEKSMILYSSDKIRIEQSYIRFMGPSPPIDVYSKGRFFSYKDTTLNIQFNERTNSLKVTEFSDSIKIDYFDKDKTEPDLPVKEYIIRLSKH